MMQKWLDKPWFKPVAAVGAVLLAALLAAGLYRGGFEAAGIALGGALGMTLMFFVGLAVIRLLLRWPSPVAGVARTLVDEAVRMKIVIVFLVTLALIVPALPFVLDPKELLKYRLQFFLTWSLSAVSILLALMTVLLACLSVCNEISQRQIFLTLTKPVARWQYLLGKWIGILLINAVLLAVVGTGIYTFARVLERQPARDFMDRLAVQEQILTARVGVGPQPPTEGGLQPLFERRVEQLRREDPFTYGERLTPEQVRGVQQQVRAQWHSIAPLESRSYLFSGLSRVKAMGDAAPAMQLRLKPRAAQPPPDEFVWLGIRINGRMLPLQGDRAPGSLRIANDTVYVVDLPVQLIDEQGDLLIQLGNINVEQPAATFDSSVTFTPGEGLELLYRIGTFEANLIRALTLLWIRLAFLAMLGLAAGAFLSFPVAALLSIMVYVTAAASGFLMESIESYAHFGAAGDATALQMIVAPFSATWDQLVQGKVWDAVKIWIRLLGQAFMFVVPSFGDFNPVPQINDGRNIPWQQMVEAAWKVGLMWTGMVAVIGYLLFRRKELARVTV